MEDFTQEERKTLSRYITDVDGDVFGLTNLPDVIKGAVFSRYSRSSNSLKRTLLDEFIKEGYIDEPTQESDQMLDVKRAMDFYNRVLIGYGDDSIAELAGCHIAVENISSLAADILTDSRIGISPLEKSARYVTFTEEALFYTPPELPWWLRGDYNDLMVRLFNFYSSNFTKVDEYIRHRDPYDREKHGSHNAYDRAMTAQTCDILKNALPACRLTNVGMYGNGRAFESLLNKIFAYGESRGQEVSKMGESLHATLQQLMPVFVKRAAFSPYFLEQEAIIKRFEPDETFEPIYEIPVSLCQNSFDPEIAVSQALLWPQRTDGAEFSKAEAVALLDELKETRTNRRQKLNRAFEAVNLSFSIQASYAAWRDIHRHRLVSQVRGPLTPTGKIIVPDEWSELGLVDDFNPILDDIKDLHEKVVEWVSNEGKHHHIAELMVPRCCPVDWYMEMNLREAAHIIELRTGAQGHPEYRKLCQDMWDSIDEVMPTLAKHILVDMNDYSIARIASENRTEQKRESLG